MTVGERIRQRRKELNLTQEELASKMGYKSRTAISNVEKDLEDLTTARVRKFAQALDCEPGYLMGWSIPTFTPNDDSKLQNKQSYSTEEQIVLECYRQLPDSEKAMVKRMIKYSEIVNKASKKQEEKEND